MNTSSIRRKLRVCSRCAFLCTGCPHALPCVQQGQRVRPMECYLCWHNLGTVLPTDCALRCPPVGQSRKRQAASGRR